MIRPARQELHNLPQPLTSFIGRQREIAEVRRLLGVTRLLTLTGTGGVGKTRLCHETAAGLLDPSASLGHAFEDGVWLVELAALADPLLVPQAVAAVLGVHEEPERSLTASLAATLHPKRLLLILDNCELLIEACAVLADALLRACPGLRILATSRQPLGIAGETTFLVPSLALTAGDDDAATPEAVSLFVDRARASLPGFTLSERNSAAVERICCRLDGIPLAIELAAARVPVLSPEQISARLCDRFRLLTGGSRTALPRYRTLRALIDWSHDLLDEKEKLLLRRLAVFAGGWTLEAAEATCAGDGLESDDVLDVLSGLVMKSLVQADKHPDEVRYGLLESIRAYAAEKLRAAGEETTLREHHRDWLLTLAEEAEPRLMGPHAVSWLHRLERERDNLRAAFGWCIEAGEAEAGLALLGSLTRFWLVRGPFPEIRSVLSALLALPTGGEHSRTMQTARAKALYAGIRLALRQGEYDVADVHLQEAMHLYRQINDRRGLAVVLFSSGYVARMRGHYPDARSQYTESLQLFETLDDTFWLAQVHHELGAAAYFDGDVATAHAHYAASLDLYKRLRDDPGIVAALNELAEVALAEGELQTARSLECIALKMARAIDDKERIAMSLAGLAGLAAALRQPTRALQLVGAATALNDMTGQRNSRAWQVMVERWLAPARRDLGAEACATAYAAGRAMPLGEAIEYALAADTPAAQDTAPIVAAFSTPASTTLVSLEPRSDVPVSVGSAPDVAAPAVRPTDQITRREREVAALIARGYSNRQIAQELVITEGTAASHVKHILARLVLGSRVQIATWAIEHGLHQVSSSRWDAAS